MVKMVNLNIIEQYKSENLSLAAETKTGKIILRPASLDDAALMAEWRSKTDEYFFNTHPPTEEYWKEFLRQKYVEDERAIMFMLEYHGIPFGHISLYDITDEGEAEYGRTVRGVENTAKGGITVATKEVIRFGFEDVELDRTYLGVFANNFRAKKVYYDCGFISKEDVEMGFNGKTWVERPELNGKAERFCTKMEITKERFDYLKAKDLFF